MSMPAVHEEVHQRAEEERQVDEDPQHVSLVLGEEEDTGNDQEAEQNKPRWRQEVSVRPTSVLFMHNHGVLLSIRPGCVAGSDQPSIRERAGSI
jgi:hypothetical protein